VGADAAGARSEGRGKRQTPQSIRLLIFDCDGVLIDSERLAVKVDVLVLRELGWPLSEAEVIERFVGRSDRDTEAEIEAHLGHKLPAGWQQRFKPLYERAFEANLAPVDGVLEALDAISLASCVASSGTHEYLRYTLGLTGLYERFAGRIFSAEDVAAGKPAPDLFLHAAEQMGAIPSACLVVEDSRPGVEAARAAGMRVLAYAGGLSPRELLEGPNTIVFEDMRELPQLLSRSRPGGPVRQEGGAEKD
jgi:HAD superfamily hydrolase (TIGR01509 family)